MKRLMILLLTTIIFFSVISCNSSKPDVELNGAVLEGYESIAFEILIKRCCELAEKDVKEETNKSVTVNYMFKGGWGTDKFKEDEYLLTLQSAVTCSIIITVTDERALMTVSQDYYLVHDILSNTLKVIGCRFYSAYGDEKYESFDSGSSAMEELEDLLSFYDKYE